MDGRCRHGPRYGTSNEMGLAIVRSIFGVRAAKLPHSQAVDSKVRRRGLRLPLTRAISPPVTPKALRTPARGSPSLSEVAARPRAKHLRSACSEAAAFSSGGPKAGAALQHSEGGFAANSHVHSA